MCVGVRPKVEASLEDFNWIMWRSQLTDALSPFLFPSHHISSETCGSQLGDYYEVPTQIYSTKITHPHSIMSGK